MTHEDDRWPDARSQLIAAVLSRILPDAAAGASAARLIRATAVDSLALVELVAAVEAATGGRMDDHVLSDFDFRDASLEELVMVLAAAMGSSAEVETETERG